MQQKRTAKAAPRSGKTKSVAKPHARARNPKEVSTEPKLTFRARSPEDDAYIVHLTEEQLGNIHEQSLQEPFPREQFQRYLQSGAPTFVVERNGKRIGYYSYLVGHDAKMHISAMVIEPQYQSDGIGTTIMKQLEADAVTRGVQLLEVFVQANNEKSLAFTRKLGFTEMYRVTPTTICFQKRLVGAVPPMQIPQGFPIQPSW
jgi:ribosomal protein S18 acetylase RimI-like enzyme